MSEYPIWWDTPITIYNKCEDKQTQVVTWYRKNLYDCFWKYSGDKVAVGNTVLETNNITCRIPKSDNYLENYKWLSIPNDLKSNSFTLQSGDIIVKGDITDDIDEYVSGKRSSDLVAKYKSLQGCMIIEESSTNVDAGRCIPHYYVKGV